MGHVITNVFSLAGASPRRRAGWADVLQFVSALIAILLLNTFFLIGAYAFMTSAAR